MKAEVHKTGYLFIQLGNAVTWLRNLKLQNTELTSTQAGIIGFLYKNGNRGITPGELARGLKLSKATISEMVKVLERKSVIIRHKDVEDGRKNLIFLTEKGMDREQILYGVAKECDEILLKGMTVEERQELHRLLGKVINNVKEYKITEYTGNCQ